MVGQECESKRKSFTVKYKLDALGQYMPGVKGKGFAAVAKRFGVSSSTLRGWYDKREELSAQLQNKTFKSRTSRRLLGGGRKCKYHSVEVLVHDWVKSRNKLGLRVKDKYIRLKALHYYRKDKPAPNRLDDDAVDSDDSVGSFQASKGWCSRFKDRYDMVSRRQTSSRILPDNADQIVQSWIQNVHHTIQLHNIKPCNIINMDQVPRYFEVEPTSTITTKGSREVLLRKGGTSHKRLTATFTVQSDGKLLTPHVLFSKLKNKPVCENGILVDVNKTGMWSDTIFLQHAKDVVLSRRQTAFSREPVLYIIDSYGCHVKMFNEKLLEKHNVHVSIVPPNLTNILQPLDVGINRSFQQFYNDQYDLYIAQALGNPDMQTKQGNVKVPPYKLVTRWILDWQESRAEADMRNAFSVCGICHPSEFSIEKLHPPLRALFDSNFDAVLWQQQYGGLIASEYVNLPSMEVVPPDFYLPVDTDSSLFACIFRYTEGAEPNQDDVKGVLENVVNSMFELPELFDIFSREDADALKRGDEAASERELFAVSRIYKLNISVSTLDDNAKVLSKFTYEGSADEPDIVHIHLQRIGGYFTMEIEN